MPPYRCMGEVPPKRHIQFRRPDGGLYAEELVGQEGFSGESSLIYHRHPPTALEAADPVEAAPVTRAPNHPLLPRHLRAGEVAAGGDLVTGRAPLLVNDDTSISFSRPTELSPWYRAADGDELVFLVEGAARLESVFGAIEAAAGDYVVVPQGATHRWVPGPASAPLALVVTTSGHVGPPDRYLSVRGQFLEHAPYCERDLHGPTQLGSPAEATEPAEPYEVLVRRQGRLTRYRYAHHPCDVVGWDGCVYPYRLAIDDFAPITGRIHQPPPVHQTFAAPGLVVCSFVPRRLDDHPEAVPAPYNHANTDSDEVLVYVDGDFTSRGGVDLGRGSLTLHPGGFVHGPQPGRVEASLGAERTDETAVMIDTFAPLDLTEEALSLDDPDYARSWLPEEDQR